MQANLTVVAAHAIAVEAEHLLIHAVPRLMSAVVHTDPHTGDGADHHADLAHHCRTQDTSLPRAPLTDPDVGP